MTRAAYPLVFFALILAVIIAPLAAILIEGTTSSSDTFSFLVDHVLFDLVLNSTVIVGVVGAGTVLIGVICAWFVVRYNFFGRGWLEWMLLLPMAMPAYIVAYAYTDFLDVAGPLSTFLRDMNLVPDGAPWMPEIRSLGGASFVLMFCLYPYVYLFARTAFLSQTQTQLDAAKSLGAGTFRQFISVALPNARPFIIVGLTLVVMETLADYGTVSYFGLRVFSTGIYDAWVGYGDMIAAARFSLILLVFVFLLMAVEKRNRANMRFFSLETQSGKVASISVSKMRSAFMMIICAAPILLGFVVPFFILGALAFEHFWDHSITASLMKLWPLFFNTSLLAFTVSVLGVFLAFGLASIKRSYNHSTVRISHAVSAFGYALPGVILGLGLLIVSQWVQGMTEYLISGSLLFLIVGYLIRFLAIPLQSFEAGFEKISPNLDAATQLLRSSAFSELWHVRLPLLWPTMLSAALVLAVEVTKELPITLILRPFDFDTLSINAYHLAADERLSEAALPSLVIVFAGLIPVFLLARLIRK